MNSKHVILLTKDAMYRKYLPLYGNTYWTTPNIDELASKGTTFRNHYTGAPSTIMANICMFSCDFAHKTELSDYVITNKKYPGKTLFDKAHDLGYECHIIWDSGWFTSSTVEYYDVYGADTIFHSLPDIHQGVGAHYKHPGFLVQDDSKTEKVYEQVESELAQITEKDEQIFVWLHIPHVINGRTGYGQDVDAFDHIVGIVRKYFQDDNIFVSADHGNMTGIKNKYCYGFDVYDPAARIPLVTPKLEDKTEVHSVTSNIDLFDLIFLRKIPQREYVFCDTAFYAQPHRKLAIITDRFKYIYNKQTKVEELYDLEWDPDETCNLINDTFYDIDRKVNSPLRELYFYPYWELAEKMRPYFREIKEGMWRDGTVKQEAIPKAKQFIKEHIYYKVKKYVVPIRRKLKQAKLNREK